jgi:multidrug efflux pump
MKELAKNFPEGRELRDRLRPDGVRAQLHRGRDPHPVRSRGCWWCWWWWCSCRPGAPASFPWWPCPVAIIGTLAALLLAGFSINSLTLVRPGAGHRHRGRRCHRGGREHRTQDRGWPESARGGARRHGRSDPPIISICLVLCAVFVPVAFVSGPHRPVLSAVRHHHRRQHLISTFNSLTLSPALAALLLKPKSAPPDVFQRGINKVLGWFFKLFNRGFESASERYGHGVRASPPSAALFSRLRGAAGRHLGNVPVVPGGFIPAQDKQYLIGIVQLPDAASLDRTEAVVKRMSDIAKADTRRRSRHRLYRACRCRASST